MPSAPDEANQDPLSFPVVGIGGSAGSLEPLREFIGELPDEPGTAFFIITHHPPSQPSLLPGLLADRSPLPVREAVDGLAVEANNVYVARPGGHWLLRDGKLVQQAQEGETGAGEDAEKVQGPPHPVDTFFRSLAAEQGLWSVGIILSGTGSDGTLGIKAIHSQGGMVMAQDPDTADFDGMPASSIATGMVDYTLPPGDMPAALVAYVRAAAGQRAALGGALPEVPEGTLGEILEVVGQRTGHDFSGYKRSTLLRRLERRMTVHRLDDPAEYLRYLRDNPAESDLLFKEILISVTNFFRDPEAWQVLNEGPLRERLLAAVSEQREFRAWVVGCATGEEAYTLAILVREWLDRWDHPPDVRIFATDVDQEAIEAARVGRYPTGIAEDVTEQRLARFFVAEEGAYRVTQNLRDMVVFAEHNALQDPPFTRMDLVSCRNLLIYLERDLQKRLLPLFRYALRDQGILFLGPSETPDELTDAFEGENRGWRIYRAKGQRQPGPLPEMPVRKRGQGASAFHGPETPTSGEAGDRFSHSVERLLAVRFAPPAVLVNDRGEAVYIHGRTGRFLEPASGPAQNQLLEMARPGLRAPLSQALREVASGSAETVEQTVQVQTNGHTQDVRLEVQRIRTPQALRSFRLVAFRPPETEGEGGTGMEPPELGSGAGGSGEGAPRGGQSDEVARLERELETSRQDKQVAVEELQSLNEELQSMNEELQSSNEELEVSKEEVESLNEELRSVNAELEARVSELSEANDDLKNLLDSTEIATLFLDEDLRVKRFTEAARKLIALRETDVGRPVSELSSDLRYRDLTADGEEVLRTLTPKEVAVQTTSGHWYLLRILPYRTTQNVIKGLVCTFQDIQSAKRLEHSEAFFRAIVETVGQPLLVLDPDFRVVSANDSFYRTFPLTPSSVEGELLFGLGEGQWDHPELRSLLEEVLPRRQSFRDFDLTADFGGGQPIRLLLNGRQMEPETEGDAMILLAMDVVDGGHSPGGARER